MKIGKDLTVNRIGLGTNRIVDDEVSAQALRKAVELGVNFIDTAAAYTGGSSEAAIGKTLSNTKNVVIATKGGMLPPPDWAVDSSPEMLSKQLEASLKNLRTSSIDLYFLHRVDPKVPLKESIGFLKQMKEDGKIKNVGLSEVTIDQIEEARKMVDIVAVENEYNLTTKHHDSVVDYCGKNGLAFVPFFPLHFQIKDSGLFERLRNRYQATDQQLALAWLLKRSPAMLPIPGSLSMEHLRQNVNSLKIDLSEADFDSMSSI
ncbi:aldo/keto reductase [Patescibacteria group bacterium]|nr:aldo/keto reductase [Patescibacteria group bacterium]